MTPEIIIAIIGAVSTIIGVIITNLTTNRRIQQQLETHMAVQDTKIEELTREVRLHNNFAQRVPVLETKLEEFEHFIEKQLEK